MKRALLIAGGTVGGLGAVLSITPPQLNAQGAMGGLSKLANSSGTTAGTVNSASTQTTAATTATPQTATPSTSAAASSTPVASSPQATATKAAVKKKRAVKKKAVVKKSTSNTTTNSNNNSTPVATAPTAASTPTQTSTPAATKSAAPAPVANKVSGTFDGPSVNVNFGNVQVQITVVDGKITAARALQAPSGGRSGSISQQAIPYLQQQTLAAQSSQIQGVSGASYTSYGWYTSLQAALRKAGLPL